MHITIRPFDPASDSDLEQHLALENAHEQREFGAFTSKTLEQYRALFAPSPYFRRKGWVAMAESLEGGEVMVGTANIDETLTENTDSSWVYVATHPAFFGRGIATQLLDEVVIPALRESGRANINTFGVFMKDEDVDNPDHPVNRLSARLGVTKKSTAICRSLSLPLSENLLHQLAAEAEEKRGDYEILQWEDTVPEEYLEVYGKLRHQLELDDPTEDFTAEAVQFPPERIREEEKRRRESGVRTLIAVAAAPDGSLVAYSYMRWTDTPETTLGYQEDTLVMPEHRGHRLGLALKVANHRRLHESAPQLTTMVTRNSHVNPWMIGINEKLGYTVANREVTFQGALGASQ